MTVELTAIEARVIGCLMEKSVITPDQYPLTLNALTNACNQKSARNPVMSLDPGEVQQALRALEAKHVVRTDENFRKQTEKYSHRFCNTPFSDHQFDEAQFAVICVLLLRGPRTPGEIKANSGRLHTFESNDAAVSALDSLISHESGPLVQMLPRTPGRRDSEYVHLFGEGADVERVEQTKVSATAAPTSHSDSHSITDRNSRDAVLSKIATLERELEELKALVRALT